MIHPSNQSIFQEPSRFWDTEMVKAMYSDTISALRLTRERHEEEDGKPGRDREMEGEAAEEQRQSRQTSFGPTRRPGRDVT